LIKKYNVDESRFYSTPFGELPSVTTIISLIKKIPGAYYSKMAVNYLKENLLDKLIDCSMSLDELRRLDLPGLMKYAKATAKRDYEAAGDIGTRVHAAIEAYFEPGARMRGIETEDDIIKPFGAFLDWVNKNDVTCALSEHTVYSKIGYAGTLDFIGTINGKKYLVDFKSSKSFWPEMPMQLAAYSYAHEEMTGEKMEGVGILRLDKETGMPEWKEVEMNKLSHYMDKFLCLLAYWEHDHDGTEKWPGK
jgi:hypothetical protein